jgi:hypothetical protein
MKKVGLCLLVFLLICSMAVANAKKSIQAVQVEKTVKVDGKLDDEVWGRSRVISGFVQYEPNKGAPASFQTEVRVVYNKEYIYFGINCLDPQPTRIVSRITKREGDLESDDSVAVALDTFNDGQTAYFFFTNLLGIQKDGRVADNGRTTDDTWDGEYLSAGSKTPQGWSAEFAIPFQTIKYKPGKNVTWGLNVVRFIPRNLETDTLTGPMESVGRASQFGAITGLNLKKMKKKRVIIPHVISKIQKGEKSEVEFGLDARYAISQSVSANLTVNPDFATVEADQEQINLTRFELQLKEKRNFFLEGSEIYSQRIRLFYSRRISDIHGGLKVHGKSKKYEFAAISVQGKKDEQLGEDSANFTVFRLRKSIFKSSNIGFLVANKLVNGKSYGDAGIDVVHFFSEKVNFTGQLAISYGDYDQENIAFFLRPSYDSSTFHIHLRYTQLGSNFADNANTVGFIRDDDRHELDSALSKTWWIKKGLLERFEYGSNYNIYWSKEGVLRSWQIDQDIEIDFTNKFSLEIDYQKEFKRYEKDFYNHQIGFELGYNTREWQSARVNYEFGKNFNSDYYLIGAGLNLKLSEKFSLEYQLNRLHLDPDPELDSTWLHVLRLNHYFSKDLFIKLFFQTNSTIDKESLQVVFVYRFQPPFGTLQLAYQRGTGRFGERGEQGDTLFLKLSYVL